MICLTHKIQDRLCQHRAQDRHESVALEPLEKDAPEEAPAGMRAASVSRSGARPARMMSSAWLSVMTATSLKFMSLDAIALPSRILRSHYCLSWRTIPSGLRHSILRSQERGQEMRHARQVIAAWRQEYNEERPHSSLGYLTPDRFAERFLTADSMLVSD